MLRTRVITAVVLLLILAAAAAVSTQALVAVGAAFLGLALAEWLRLSAVPAPLAAAVAAGLAGAALALELAGLRPAPALLALLCALACCAWASKIRKSANCLAARAFSASRW